MNKHSVKFVRGSKTIWDQLNTTPEKIDNNTLYFIYEDENYSVGKLYLGQRLITDDKIINIKDIGDIQIEDESLIDKQILIYNEENQEWKNSSLEEIIDLSNYYTKNEINNNISTKMDLAPLNPTAQEIEDIPDGQLYSDTANHKGVIKGGQSFYDTDYIDTAFAGKLNDYSLKIPKKQGDISYNVGDTFYYHNRLYKYRGMENNAAIFDIIGGIYVESGSSNPPTQKSSNGSVPYYAVGDCYIKKDKYGVVYGVWQCIQSTYGYYTSYFKWLNILSKFEVVSSLPSQTEYGKVYLIPADSNPDHQMHYEAWTVIPQQGWTKLNMLEKDYYTKTDIDTMIGGIGTALDTLNNNLAGV